MLAVENNIMYICILGLHSVQTEVFRDYFLDFSVEVITGVMQWCMSSSVATLGYHHKVIINPKCVFMFVSNGYHTIVLVFRWIATH